MSLRDEGKSKYFFREKMGLSPKRYQLKIRLERAARLLASTQTPVTDIAHQVGFKTATAFSSAFVRVYGLSPTRYRIRA